MIFAVSVERVLAQCVAPRQRPHAAPSGKAKVQRCSFPVAADGAPVALVTHRWPPQNGPAPADGAPAVPRNRPQGGAGWQKARFPWPLAVVANRLRVGWSACSARAAPVKTAQRRARTPRSCRTPTSPAVAFAMMRGRSCLSSPSLSWERGGTGGTAQKKWGRTITMIVPLAGFALGFLKGTKHVRSHLPFDHLFAFMLVAACIVPFGFALMTEFHSIKTQSLHNGTEPGVLFLSTV
jgi:hypothetical protein